AAACFGTDAVACFGTDAVACFGTDAAACGALERAVGPTHGSAPTRSSWTAVPSCTVILSVLQGRTRVSALNDRCHGRTGNPDDCHREANRCPTNHRSTRFGARSPPDMLAHDRSGQWR